MATIFFITHPDVLIDPTVPVTDWSLSDRGVKRFKVLLAKNWIKTMCSVYSSTERKTVEGADLLGEHLNLPVTTNAQLGENDRSATGYLPPDKFETAADQFFANPDVSIHGWERAIDAQSRIVSAVQSLVESESTNGPCAVVSHGAVGTLLLCHLNGWAISREHDQPGGGGGNYFSFESDSWAVNHGWRSIDA